MRDDVHGRAARLILDAQIDEISDSDREWLANHMETCVACAAHAASIQATVRFVRSAPVELDPAVVSKTRTMVQQRARDLHQGTTSRVLLGLAVVLSWAWIIASTPYLWRGLEWISTKIGVPRLIWQMAFGLWWVLPALALAAVLSELRNRQVDLEDIPAAVRR